MNWATRFISLFTFLYICTCISCNEGKQDTLIIAAAANMQYAMDDLVTLFEETHDISCDLVIGSSGKLTTQILQGAPYNIFFAADMTYPNEIKRKLSDVAAPKVYAKGALIAAFSNHEKEPANLKLESVVESNQSIKIAIANPKFAPYGKIAAEVLENLKLLDKENIQLIKAESISQVNQYILSSSVDIGITSKSSLNALQQRDELSWENIDTKWYTPLSQGAIILKSDKKGKAAEAALFLNFVLSPKGQEILSSNGYLVHSK